MRYAFGKYMNELEYFKEVVKVTSYTFPYRIKVMFERYVYGMFYDDPLLFIKFHRFKKLVKATGKSFTYCADILEQYDWDYKIAFSNIKENT